MDEIKNFLDALFENKPENTYIIVWQTPLKRTNRFKKTKDAAEFVNKIKNTPAEIYFGCGLQDKDHGTVKRGSKEDIVGLPGFYIDIDIKDPVHKNTDLPDTVEEAVTLVKNNGFDPTMIVHTGHGLHVYWLFKEPEMFSDQTHRKKVEMMCRRLQQTIKQKAKDKGWSLDSTFDTTRVLRIPGTFNQKDGSKIKVKVIEDNGPRYGEYKDFDEFLIPEDELEKISPAPTKEEQTTILNNITLSPMAVPPAEMVDWLCDIDTKFKATYQGKRDPKSFPGGKATPSECALSLASIAVQAGWSDQEIADLIIDWYRRHGHDINKATRGDYIARTLAVAKKDVDAEFVKDYEKNVEPTEGTKYHKAVDPEGEKTKKMLSIELRFKPIRLVKYVREKDPFYVMYTDKKEDNPDGTIRFKTQNHLIKKDLFTSAVFAQINHYVSIPPRKWPKIVDKFTEIMETVVPSKSSFITGRMKEWISDYLESKRPYNVDDTTASKEPFVHKGHWYVDKHQFSRWCYNHRSHLEGVEKTELDLVLVGSEEKRFNPKHPSIPNKRTTRRAFKIPSYICKPPKKKKNQKTNKSLDGYAGSDPDDAARTIH